MDINTKGGDGTVYPPSAHGIPRVGLEAAVGARGDRAAVVHKGLCLTQVQQGHQPKPVTVKRTIIMGMTLVRRTVIGHDFSEKVVAGYARVSSPT